MRKKEANRMLEEFGLFRAKNRAGFRETPQGDSIVSAVFIRENCLTIKPNGSGKPEIVIMK